MVAILGLNAFHSDASTALLIDGQLMAAMEEEGIQESSMTVASQGKQRGCLEMAGLSIDHPRSHSNKFRLKSQEVEKLLLPRQPSPSSNYD